MVWYTQGVRIRIWAIDGTGRGVPLPMPFPRTMTVVAAAHGPSGPTAIIRTACAPVRRRACRRRESSVSWGSGGLVGGHACIHRLAIDHRTRRQRSKGARVRLRTSLNRSIDMSIDAPPTRGGLQEQRRSAPSPPWTPTPRKAPAGGRRVGICCCS